MLIAPKIIDDWKISTVTRCSHTLIYVTALVTRAAHAAHACGKSYELEPELADMVNSITHELGANVW